MIDVSYKVKCSDVNKNLKISWVSLIQMLQESAIVDDDKQGYGLDTRANHNTAFLLLYSKINMQKFPRWNETVKIKTWCNQLEKIYYYRNYEILNEKDEIIGTGLNKLLVYDSKNKKPKRIDENLKSNIKIYNKYLYENNINKNIDVPYENKLEDKYFQIRPNEIDINGHLNNVRYVDLAENMVYNNEYNNIEVYYKKEIKEIDNVYCAKYIQNNDCIVEIKSKDVSNAIIKFF